MNEIRILVRTQNDAKAGFQEVNKDLDTFAKESSERFSKTFSENMTRTFTTKINEAVTKSEAGVNQAGSRIGDTLGKQISTKITENINRTVRDYGGNNDRTRVIGGGSSSSSSSSSDRDHTSVSNRDHVSVSDRERVNVHVDVDKQSLFSKLGSFGKEAGEKFGSFFQDGWKTTLTGVFSGDLISTIVKGLVGGGLVAALAPVLGAAFNSAILLGLGGAPIAVGIIGALKDPRIQTALSGLKDRFKSIFDDFSENFKGPLENFLAPGNGGGGGITGVLDQVESMIKDIGKVFGPVADQLGQGIIGFLQNALPGIMRAVEAAAPIVNTLSDELPGIGKAMGDFFDHISAGAPGAKAFLRDFLNLIEWLIPKIGALIEVFSDMYLFVRQTFLKLNILAADWGEKLLTVASVAFSWIPGMQGNLLNARNKLRDFKESTNKTLHDIDNDVDINVRLHVWGMQTWNNILSVGRALKREGYIGRAAGGVTGQAASGGPRSNRTWVGENGPELVDLAPGSQVHTAGDSRRLAAADAGMGGGGTLMMRATVDRSQSANRELIDMLLQTLRLEIFNVAGGDAQMALGS